MVMPMKASGTKMLEKALEYRDILKETYMRESGLETECTEKEYCFMLMVLHMKDFGNMVKRLRGTESSNTLTEMLR